MNLSRKMARRGVLAEVKKSNGTVIARKTVDQWWTKQIEKKKDREFQRALARSKPF